MSGLRDVVFAAVVLGLVPVSFLRPWLGVLAWSWIAYMAPHLQTWGFGRSIPVALLIGGATLAGFVLARDRQPIPRTAGTVLMLVLGAHFTLTTLLAFNPALAYGKWDWVMKSMLMTFVTMALFQDRTRLRVLFLVIALSMGFWGFKGASWVLRGGQGVEGPEGTFFGDNNTLGLAMCMVLPLLLYLSRDEPRRWLKVVLRVTFASTMVAIVFTYSRGAFLGLTVIAAVLIWRSPWRLRFGVAFLAAALIVAPLLPQRLWERIESITDQTNPETRDRSAAVRIEAWTMGLNVALSRPFIGGGFRAFQNDWVWNEFDPESDRTVDMLGRVADAHSLYFEVLGEHGFLGLGLYMALLLTTLWQLGRIRKRWRGHPEHGYLSRYAEMVQLSLVPFMVAGAFLTVAYFDLYQHLVGTSIILQKLAARAVATEDALAAPRRPVSAAGSVRRLAAPARRALGARPSPVDRSAPNA